MRYHSLLIVAATFVALPLGLEAAVVTDVVPSVAQPGVVAKSTTRSYSGAVQAVERDGVIRLRDDRLGDIKLFVTTETQIRKAKGGAATVRDIRVGTRLHGSGAIFGERYKAKVITIDS